MPYKDTLTSFPHFWIICKWICCLDKGVLFSVVLELNNLSTSWVLKPAMFCQTRTFSFFDCWDPVGLHRIPQNNRIGTIVSITLSFGLFLILLCYRIEHILWHTFWKIEYKFMFNKNTPEQNYALIKRIYRNSSNRTVLGAKKKLS